MKSENNTMLAPNGKPSNLSIEQWHLVRTPEFKAWFGDWEKLAMAKLKDAAMDDITLANLSKDVSKVIDENGEPLVMWHKSTSIEPFFEFDKKYINKNDPDFWSNGFWFSRDIGNTAAWTKLGGEGFINSYFLNIRNILENDKINEYEKIYEDEIENNDGTKNRLNLIERGYNGVEFIKIINPIPILNQIFNRNEKIYIDRNSHLRLGKSGGDLVYHYIENGQNVDAIYLDTWDGKKLDKQTLDYQLSKIEDLITEGVVIAFEPNQIKLADGSNTTFDGNNPDIRYAEGGDVINNDMENTNEQMTQQPQINPDGTQAEKPSMGERAKDFLKAAITPNPKRKLDYLKENPDVVMAAVTRNPRYLMENGGQTDDEGNLINLKIGDIVVEYKRPTPNQPKREYGGNGKIILIVGAMAKVNFEPNDYEQWIALKDLKKVENKMKYGGELQKGIKAEMEHKDTIENFKKHGISDRQVAESIAKDHLKEDPQYYSKLSEMESKMAKGGIIEINQVYLIGKPMIDIVGRFGKKRALFKTIKVDSQGNKIEGQISFDFIGSFRKLNLDSYGIRLSQKEFDIMYEKMESKMGNGGNGDAISTFGNETLPNQKIWDDMVNSINTEDSYTDISKLELGDVVLMRDGGLGFVTKINPKTIKVLKYMQKGAMGKIDPELYEVMIEKDLIDVFKKPKKNADAMLQNDVKISSLVVSTKLEDYKNPYEINRAIEKLIDERGEDQDKYTPEEINFIGYYSGYGGLEKYGSFSDEELKGLLYEFFTPDEVVKKMWGLAYKYGYGTIGDNSVFEPSVGIGAFLKYAPSDAVVEANEINRYSATICKILYPHARVSLMPFETNFIKRNESVKGSIDSIKKYSLVIGNPPYGKLLSKYIAMGEDKYTKAQTFTEYFIFRGLDLLQSGGLLIYVVGAQQYNGGTLFLDSDVTKAKLGIFDKAELIDAYRLPINIFERTGVSSEILIFKKR